MAATRISLVDVNGPYVAESATQLSTLTFTAADNANGNVVDISKRTCIIFENTSGGALTVTVTSYADPYGRTADITAFSVAAGARVARIFEPDGWTSIGGSDLEFTCSAATMEVCAFRVY